MTRPHSGRTSSEGVVPVGSDADERQTGDLVEQFRLR